ncbi:hypothetical protein BKA69DRAFT_761796 [Paraphysoderma sedebokerense]|nr:hypothetical protein BKA69DRAFT_761796 [Paraphysoderma sedebokerense]
MVDPSVNSTSQKLKRYNLAVADQFRLPTFSYAAVNETFLESNGQEERTTLGILVGNTKLLWPCFINYLKANPSHIDNLNPVDSYVANSLEASLDQTLSNLFQSSSLLPKFEIRYYWDKAPKFVAMQRLAHEAGLAYYNTDCFLNIHSEYGPWLALRSAS